MQNCESTERQLVDKTEQHAALITKIQAGDQTAVEELYHEVMHSFRPLVLRSVPPQNADDVLHSGFLDLLLEIRKGTISRPGALFGFARAVVRNKVYRYIRDQRLSRERTCHLDESLSEWMGDERINPDSHLFESERATQMAEVIEKKLSPKQRDILIRFYLHGQPRELIMAEMNLTAGQYRNIKSQAKAQLEEEMKRYVVREASPLKRLRLAA